MSKRDSFIFYRSFFEATKPLKKNEKAELFDAICNFALDQELTELKPLPKAMFHLIQPQLEANYKKYLNGIKPKQKTNKPEAKPKQKVSKTEGNVNDNDNDNVNLNGNVNVNVNDKKKKTPTGGSETSSLFTMCKSEFIIQYLEITGNEFYFNAKSAGSLKTLINQIKYSVKEKKEKDSAQKEKSATDVEVFESLQYILMNLPDWFKQNLSLAILSSKYNELINQLRNGKGSTINKLNKIKSGFAKIDELNKRSV